MAVRRPPARPEPRHRRRHQLRAGAARSAGRRCWRRSATSATSSTAASRAATSRATTAGRSDGVHAVQLEMCWRCYMAEAPPYAVDAARGAAASQPVLRDAAAGDARLRADGRCAEPAAPLGAARLDRPAAGASTVVLLRSTATAAGPRSRPASRRRRRQAHACSTGRCCPAWSTRTAMPSSAPSPAWPSAATAAQRRLLVVARPHVPRRAAHHARRSCAAIAAQLYVELLRGGYTQVCEFHYLQHDVDGRPYADPLAMAWALADAAAEAGIGLTLLPVLYERAGFAHAGLRDDQRRFATSAADVLARAAAIAAAGRPLRQRRRGDPFAARRAPRVDRRAAPAARDGFAGPIHIHVAEQTARGRRLRRRHRLRGRSSGWRAGACSTRAGSSCTPPTPTPAEIDAVGAERRRRRAVPEHRSQPRRRPLRPAAAGSPPACRWRSAPTATSRAAGPKSCAGSSTASAWRGASATSPPRRRRA